MVQWMRYFIWKPIIVKLSYSELGYVEESDAVMYFPKHALVYFIVTDIMNYDYYEGIIRVTSDQ